MAPVRIPGPSCGVAALILQLFVILLIASPASEPFSALGAVPLMSWSAQERSSSTPLRLSEPIKRDIAGEEVHDYDVEVETGQYVHVVVDQGGSDLTVSVAGPDGEQAQFDGRWHGPESVSVSAKVQGRYQFRVRLVTGSDSPRPYDITLVAIRPFTDQDTERITAERLATTAKPSLMKPSAASLSEALDAYERALPLWRSVGDQYGEAQTLNGLGVISGFRGELDKALTYLRSAEALWRDLNYATGEAETVSNIGAVHNRKGQKRQAIPLYERALAIHQHSGNRAMSFYALNNLGAAYSDLGEGRKALDYLEQALPLADAARDYPGLIMAHTNIAVAYDLLGEPERALQSYERAMKFCHDRNKNAPCVAGVLLNSGTTMRRVGDYQRAAQFFEEASQLAKAAGDQRLYGMSILSLGGVLQELGQRDEALARYREALPILQMVQDSRGEGLAQVQIGESLYGDGAYDAALRYLQRGRMLLQSAGDSRNEAHALHGIARVQHLLGSTSETDESLSRALELARATRDAHTEAQTLLALGQIERDRGSLLNAKSHLENALLLIEALRFRVSRQPLRSTLLASKHNYYATHIDTLMRLHDQQHAADFDAQALEASERARARGLLDLLSEAGADVRDDADPSLLARERSLRQLLNAKSDKQALLFSSKQTAVAGVELGKEIDQTIVALQAVEAEIRTRSPRYAALTQPKPLSVTDLRRDLLDDETALVEYSLGDEQSYVWVLTTTGLVSARLPGRSDIEEAARQLYEALTARSKRPTGESGGSWVQRVQKADSDLSRRAAAVSRIVLSPVSASLKKRRLVIVSDGALSYLPFGVLPDPNVPGSRPLLVDHEIVTAPSASVLTLLRRDFTAPRGRPLTVAVIADPVFDRTDGRVINPAAGVDLPAPAVSTERDLQTWKALERATVDLGIGTPFSLGRLSGSREEARRIQSHLPRQRSLVALDFDASVETATSPKLADYAVVHFATHTLIDTQHPELSGIVLSLVNRAGEPQPGFLRLHDIYNLRLPVELVVLSACQTALGQEIRGEGLVGLSRGFMYAGAPRVVVSLWKVDDRATVALMDYFYGMVRAGSTPAAALRSAQDRMRMDPQWSRPFYWAGFVIQGEWR